MEENPSSSRSSSQFGGTPRETQFYSPRDDRFVSPRQEALRSSRTASSDEKWDNNAQWSTPREENRVMRASSSMEKMASDHWSTPRSDRPSPRHPYPLQRQSSNSSDEYNSARSDLQMSGQYDDRNNAYHNHYQSSQPYYTQPPPPSSSSSYMLQPQMMSARSTSSADNFQTSRSWESPRQSPGRPQYPPRPTSRSSIPSQQTAMYGPAAPGGSDDKYGSTSGYGYGYNGISSGSGYGSSSSSGYSQGYGVGSKDSGGLSSPVQQQQQQYHSYSSSGAPGHDGKAIVGENVVYGSSVDHNNAHNPTWGPGQGPGPGQQQYVGGTPTHQGGHGYSGHSHGHGGKYDGGGSSSSHSHSKGYSPHHDLDESIGEIYVPPHHSPQPGAPGSSSSMGGQAMGGSGSTAISEEDVSDLFSFARHGRVEEIERMLNRGVPVDVRDEWGNTLLTTACQNGNKRVAKAVLRRGANINARNAKGNTPLHYCFHFGYGDTLGQYIISKGADESARNNQGKPPWDGI